MSQTINNILLPLQRHYAQENVVELRITEPYYVTLDIRGQGLQIIYDNDLSLSALKFICQCLANKNGIQFSKDKPQISCTLPDGHRFECLMGRSVQSGISLAIRCKHDYSPSWQDMGIEQNAIDYLEQATTSLKNIIISGGTNTGKTTLMNKMLEFVPAKRRIITIEDTPELNIKKFQEAKNSTFLIAARDGSSYANMVDYKTIYDHVNRATPTQVIFSEASIANCFLILATLNSGNTGMMFTIHAVSPEELINEKFNQNLSFNGQHIDNVSNYVRRLIDVIVQIKRDANTDMRKITDIYEPKHNRYIMRDGVMA